MSGPALDYDEDDVPQQPLRIFLFNDSVASIDGELLMGARGPHGLRAIANRLLAMGHDPDRELHIRRAGGEGINRILLRDAADQGEEF